MPNLPRIEVRPIQHRDQRLMRLFSPNDVSFGFGGQESVPKSTTAPSAKPLSISKSKIR
jgi:hypothetical protein